MRVVRNVCVTYKRVCQADSRTSRLRGQVRSQQQSESLWLRKNGKIQIQGNGRDPPGAWWERPDQAKAWAR